MSKKPTVFCPKTTEELKDVLENKVCRRRFVIEGEQHDWECVFEDGEYCCVDLCELQRPVPEEKREEQHRGVEIVKPSSSCCGGSKAPQGRIICKDPLIVEERFKNWAGTQRMQMVKAAYPKKLDHLKKIIKMAKKDNLRVRCAGRTHSWSPMFADEGHYLVYVHNLQSDYGGGKRIRMSKDSTASNPQVDVMAGVPLADVKAFQLANRVNLPCNVILTVVQLVGVVVMGCHGVGWDCKSVCDKIAKMRILNSDGKLVTYSVEVHGEEMMNAVRANFGMFGIIYDVTMNVDKQTIVKTENRYLNMGDVFYNPENLKKLIEDNFSVELFWFPFNESSILKSFDPRDDEVWVRVINKVSANDAPKLAGPDFYKKMEHKDNLSQTVLREVGPFVTDMHWLTPFSQNAGFAIVKNIYKTDPIYQELPHAVHFRSHIEKAPVYDLEYAFDYKGDYSLVCTAVQKVADMVQKKAKQFKYPLNVALEIRFMAYSDVYMCPAALYDKSQSDPHIVYIEVLSLVGTDGWFEFCQEVADEWQKLGGVPHFAKQWAFLNDIDNYIRQKFGDNMTKFKQQLEKSKADPNRMFFNDRLEKLFYPS